MSPIAPVFVFAMLLCFVFGVMLVVTVIAVSFLRRFGANRFITFLSFALAGSAGVLAGCYLLTLSGVGLSYLTEPGAWRSWLFLACVFLPHLLWCMRFRRPLFAGLIALITLSGVAPEFFSIVASA
jgi:hypothetical protein